MTKAPMSYVNLVPALFYRNQGPRLHMEREPAEITVEADVYNGSLLISKTIRDIDKRGIPVTIKVGRAKKSIELDIAVKILEQIEQGALQAAGAGLIVGLYHYLTTRRRKLAELRRRGVLRREEYITIKRENTEWRRVVREYSHEDSEV